MNHVYNMPDRDLNLHIYWFINAKNQENEDNDKCQAKISPNSNCFKNSTTTTTGCDDTQCEILVCDCDPYCCSTVWDMSCSGNNNTFVPNCSAGILCCPSSLILSVNEILDVYISYDGESYSVNTYYPTDCSTLSCVDTITLRGFPENNYKDVHFDEKLYKSTSSIRTWYGEPSGQTIGEMNFIQDKDNKKLTGSSNVNSYIFQFATRSDKLYVTVTNSSNFPED